MFSETFTWLAEPTLYPRWALIIMVVVCFLVVVALLFLAWFQWDSQRWEVKMDALERESGWRIEGQTPNQRKVRVE